MMLFKFFMRKKKDITLICWWFFFFSHPIELISNKLDTKHPYVCWLNPLPSLSPQMIIMKICCLLLGSTVHVSDRQMSFLLNMDFIFSCTFLWWWLTCKWIIDLKLHLWYLFFFPVWTGVLNHNKYVEMKQFSKVDIKQNNISTVILLIKFLVYQWDPRHLQGSRVVYIFIYTLYSCSI